MQNRNYQKIWKVVTLIPEGKVASYGQIADLAGLPGNARLVGRALRQAPADHKLPWHRVVNARGRIAFESASPKYREQKALLTNEGVLFSGLTIIAEQRWTPNLSLLMWELDY